MIKGKHPTDEVVFSSSAMFDTKTKSILFATDFSPQCRAALEWAAALARDLDARLLIVHVEQPGVPYGGGEIYSDYVFDCNSKALMKQMEKVKPSDPEVQFRHHLVSGDPAAEILRIAVEQNVQMIVMSTHGRRGLPRVLMGSVAESVVRQATCPIIIYKSAALANT